LKTRTWLDIVDAEQDLKDLWAEIERRSRGAQTITLEKRTLIRKTSVSAGPYRMIIVEMESSSDRLYLFRGNRIDPKKPALEIPVTLTVNNEPAQGVLPVYRIEQGWRILQGVRIAGRTVRIIE
jgi:hypothetical protein